jgi:hypothetical protein
MKKFATLILLFVITHSFAQKEYNLGTEPVFVPGQIVSTIKLVDYNNKQIGTRVTHTSFDNKKTVFTSITSDDNGPYIIIMQVISKDALKGLVQDIEVKKAWLNPEEEKTIPKNYWDVSIGFRKPNQDIVEVGSTTYYKKEDGTAIINKYLGTTYIVPFATKAAADTFVASLKKFLK